MKFTIGSLLDPTKLGLEKIAEASILHHHHNPIHQGSELRNTLW